MSFSFMLYIFSTKKEPLKGSFLSLLILKFTSIFICYYKSIKVPIELMISNQYSALTSIKKINSYTINFFKISLAFFFSHLYYTACFKIAFFCNGITLTCTASNPISKIVKYVYNFVFASLIILSFSALY